MNSVARDHLPQILSGVTAAYSVAILAYPNILAKPSGYVSAAGTAPRPVRTTIRAIGARDLAISVATLLAPDASARRSAVAARAASDYADALIFAHGLPRGKRSKIAGFAILWGSAHAYTLVGR